MANSRTIQVTPNGMNGSTNFAIPMSILIGDTNGNGTVSASGLSQTKSGVSHAVDVTNFRSDVMPTAISMPQMFSIAKSSVGTGLP